MLIDVVPFVLSLAQSTSDSIAWVKAHAIPVATVEAGHGFKDLEPLRSLIGDARIVALGECTHGSREVFQMKHRIVEFLASEMGFTIFSIEASTPESFAVNDYVSKGRGDPAALIRGMYFWTWSTAEVLDMVRWMKAYNDVGKKHIDFTGFDMQEPKVAARIVTAYLERVDPDAAAKAKIAYGIKGGITPRGGGTQFGVATGSFSVDACKGRKIKYSAWIRTEGVTEYAGLWWRADGPSGAVAFDNMSGRGPSGESDWKQYSVELEVPKETVNINFGVLLPGDGRAWFDGLTVEIDGKPFTDAEFDFGFEAGKLRGFSIPEGNYEVAFDREVFHEGACSLRMSKRDSAAPAEPVGDPGARIRETGTVLSELEARRDAFVAASSEPEFEWVKHNAVIVVQQARMESEGRMGGKVRDECMAENVQWILDHNPGARIVLWAHNGHVGRTEGSMGSHLARMYGKDYFVLGFATHEGTYTAMKQGQGLVRDNPLKPSPPGSMEAVLHAAEMPLSILDVRSADAANPASAFLATPTPMRSIGALAMEQQFFPQDVRAMYDGVVWIEKSTASREMPK